MKAGARATYLYALVKSAREPSLAGLPAGLPSAGRGRLVPAGDGLWLVVADVPAAEYGATAIERGLRDLDWVAARALAHERVVEHVRRAGTVVPMKLFTLFASDERAVTHIRRSRRGIQRVVERIAGRDEWGVRVRFDARRAAAAGDGARHPTPEAGRGTRFLLLKRRDQTRQRRLLARGRGRVPAVFRALAREAVAARRLPVVGDGPTRLLLDAAFLVERARASVFRARVRALRTREAALGLDITLTGPWPPYNFIARP